MLPGTPTSFCPTACSRWPSLEAQFRIVEVPSLQSTVKLIGDCLRLVDFVLQVYFFDLYGRYIAAFQIGPGDPGVLQLLYLVDVWGQG